MESANDRIKKFFRKHGAEERQIRTALLLFSKMDDKNKAAYLNSLSITEMFDDMLDNLESTMEINYDSKGVPESIALKANKGEK